MDQATLANRINSISPCVRAYEVDSLLAYARSVIPQDIYRCDSTGAGSSALKVVGNDSRNSTHPYFSFEYLGEEFCPEAGQINDDLVLALVRWFKYKFFKWYKPRCPNCDKGGPNIDSVGVVGPSTPLEISGKASRVECYKCKACSTEFRFPRFNDVRTLLSPDGRRGRCGEFANAFTCILRCVGFEARYVLDLTDHVWCEYWSERMDRWVHVDPCEAKVDGAGIYEKGWGKKLNYVFAGSKDEICDVTAKYSRAIHSQGMKVRRNHVLGRSTRGCFSS